MRRSDFIFESVQRLYYKFNKINFKPGGSLNYGEIKWNLERVSNNKLYIMKYNWKWRNYPTKIDDWKTFEKNTPTIALNILHIKEKEICPVYILKHNSTHVKQIIVLMIPN